MQKYNKTNLAYDLSRFETKEKTQVVKQPEIVALPEAKSKTGSIIICLLCAAVAFGLLFAMISNKVQISALNDNINKSNTAILEATKDNARLQAMLDSQVTLKTIEQKASEELGLRKASQEQTEYIKTDTVKKIEVSGEVGESNFSTKIKNWFDNILEYLGF